MVIGQCRDDGVGCGQDPRTRPEVHVQRQLLGGRAIDPAELRGELHQVEDAGAAPCVDVLIRVTDGRHGEAVAEHRVDELRLGDVGVLVLVEERRVEPITVPGRHLRVFLDQLQGEGDLVPEVDDPQFLLLGLEHRDRASEFDARQSCFVGFVASVSAKVAQPGFVEGDDPFGRDAMVRHLLCEVEDVPDQRGLPRRAHVVERHLVQDARAKLGALCGAQHTLSRLHTHEQSVALQQPRSEAVVVHDLGLFALGEFDGPERATDAQHQVLGGLVRECQCENVARHDSEVIGLKPPSRHERQVDNACGHHRGLARTRAGHQHVGLQRHRDGLPLFLGRFVTAECLDDFGGEGRAHVASSATTAWGFCGNSPRPSG